MADSKLSALAAASTLAGADLAYVVQGGVSKQATLTSVWAGAGVVAAPAPNGTDDGAALNTFLAANRGRRIVFPPGLYKTSIPIVVYDRTIIEGAGSTPNDTFPFATEFVALAGFTGIAVIVSNTWTAGGFWHWSSIRDIRVNSAHIASHGIALYQMGEVSSLMNCQVDDAVTSNIRLAGVHAPATIINCCTNGQATAGTATQYGLELGSHPTLGAGAQAGAVRIFGLSGDRNSLAHVRISGTHFVSIDGLKSEFHPANTILFDGANSGGNSPSLALVGGYDQNPTSPGVGCTDVIKITGTTYPSITLVGYGCTTAAINASCKLINDTVRSRTVPLLLGGTQNRISLVTYGQGGQSYFGDEPILGTQSRLMGITVSTNVIAPLIDYASDEVVHHKAGTTNGLTLEDSTGAQKLKVNGTGIAFYTNTPVAKAGAITTPNTQTASYVQADVASLKTAIDAIRTALTNIGITA